MSDFFKWLISNPVAASALLVTLIVLATVVLVVYVVAFFQDREISFWPPRIGGRLEKLKSSGAAATIPGAASAQEIAAQGVPSNPIVGAGTILSTASGETMTIESGFYGGSVATLFRARSSSGQRVMVKLYWRWLEPDSESWTMFSQELRTALSATCLGLSGDLSTEIR